MSEWRYEREKDEDEEIGRQDCFEGYCPRKDDKTVIISSRCFYHDRNRECDDCVFDQDPICVKLILIMCEILEERGKLTC